MLASFLQEEPFFKGFYGYTPIPSIYLHWEILTSVIIRLEVDVCNSLRGTPSQETIF